MSRASFTLNSQSIWDPHLQYCCLVALQWMGGMKLCAVAPSSPQLGPFLKMFEFWKILMWGFIVEKRCIWNVRKCDKTQTFQNIIMPPKSDYWKYFLVQGVLAVCQISGCPKPNVSLGPEAKPGYKKRISKYILYMYCI